MEFPARSAFSRLDKSYAAALLNVADDSNDHSQSLGLSHRSAQD